VVVVLGQYQFRNFEDVAKWETYLKAKDVKILGVMDWERGGRSVYFADPDGHVGEMEVVAFGLITR